MMMPFICLSSHRSARYIFVCSPIVGSWTIMMMSCMIMEEELHFGYKRSFLCLWGVSFICVHFELAGWRWVSGWSVRPPVRPPFDLGFKCADRDSGRANKSKIFVENSQWKPLKFFEGAFHDKRASCHPKSECFNLSLARTKNAPHPKSTIHLYVRGK